MRFRSHSRTRIHSRLTRDPDLLDQWLDSSDSENENVQDNYETYCKPARVSRKVSCIDLIQHWLD